MSLDALRGFDMFWIIGADALAIVSEDDDSLPEGAEVAIWWLDQG